MTLSRRLFLNSVLGIGVLVALVMVAVDWRLRVRLRDATAAELVREARLVASTWRPGIDADSLADAAGTALGHRVTLIRADGVVIGDSEFDDDALARLENHADRPEVRAARAAGSGSAVRRSRSAGDDELYAAVEAPIGVSRVSISMAFQAALVRRVQRDVFAAAALAMLLALVLAWVSARTVTHPILRLRDDAQALAAGDLSRRPAVGARGEVGELSAAFHRLAEQLSARLRALEADDALLRALTESLNEGVVAVDAHSQVIHVNARARRLLSLDEPVPFAMTRLAMDPIPATALRDALAGVTTTEREFPLQDRTLTLTARPLDGGGAVLAFLDITPIRRLELVRRDFVANVSHELRTPLTVVSGFAETLLDDGIAPADRTRFTTAVLANTRRMQRIVDDLLDLSRIESGGWRPNPEWVDPHAVALEVLGSARPLAERKGLALVADIPADVGRVHADATAIRQVAANLVDNALRHTAQGTVRLRFQPEPDGTWLGVEDTGVGIAPEHLPRIFERFYRVDSARSRQEGGTGLGLAIVKHLMEEHGGRVVADSTVGVGTRVRAFFPMPARPAPEADDAAGLEPAPTPPSVTDVTGS